VSASDESFGNKEHLLTPGAADFVPGTYDHRGEVVDGWETRRRRDPGHDWVIVRLGLPGVIHRIDVDTSFFTGNHPETCWLEACGLEGYPSPAELAAAPWVPLSVPGALKGDAHNLIEIEDRHRFTHVRLSVAPDGGVARLRVHGVPVLDPRLTDAVSIDLASQQVGGAVVGSSDSYFSSARALNLPDRARTMGEGWETRRRRDGGHDWVVFRLAAPGDLRQVEIDTTHFKHNASSHVEVWMTSNPALPEASSPDWVPLAPRTAVQPDTRHVFAVRPDRAATFVRVDAYPDGGLSRVRLVGTVTRDARIALGLAWVNALPDDQAATVLRVATDRNSRRDSDLSSDTAAAVLARRPFSTLEDVRHLARDLPPARPGEPTPAQVADALCDLLTGDGTPTLG
jgi:allantoicase